MFTSFATARDALEVVARDFDPLTLTGDDARRAVDELGTILRLTDAMLAIAAKRVADRTSKGQENGAAFVARSLGVSPGEVRAAIGTAAQLEHLPDTDAAVRAGRLSPGQARMIAGAATKNPAAEAELLAAAALGLVPLRTRVSGPGPGWKIPTRVGSGTIVRVRCGCGRTPTGWSRAGFG